MPTNLESAPVASPVVRPPATRSRLRPVVLTVVGVALAVWLGKFLYHLWTYETTDDAYVTGHIDPVSTEISGPVQAVLVADNQTVQAGQPLVRLDPLEYTLAVDKARAGLARALALDAQAQASDQQAEAEVATAQARLAQAQAQIAQTRAQAALARLTLDRDRQMAGGADRAVTQAELDSAQGAYDAAAAAVVAAEANATAAGAQLKGAEASRAASAAQRQSAAAEIAAARTGIADAKRQLGYAEIVAPAAGRVGNKNVEVGSRVQTGQTLMVVVEPETWIVANFKETQLARMHSGQAAEVTFDAIPDHSFTGQIQSIAPASGAQFALLPADNATGNFTKVVQRVPVKITFAPGVVQGFEDRIRPGLSAVAEVRIR